MSIAKLKLAIALCALAPLAVWAGDSIDQSWSVNSDVRVSVENVAGEIEIRGWDQDEVQLTGTLGDSVDELEIDESSAHLQITVVNRDQRNIDETVLVLRVPEGANVEAIAVSADIEISALDNEKVTGTSVSGDVEVQAKSQWVSLESVSGDVGFRGQTPRISAESVSGDVELSGLSGDVEATTVSGDMEIEVGVMEKGKFETVSGDIQVSTALSPNGRLSAESMSGDVIVSLPAKQSGVFKAQSFSGRISTDFGSVSDAKHGPGSHLKHAVGNDSAEIRLESFSGNIKLIMAPIISFAGEGGKAKIITGAKNAAQCISPVQVNNIDGREVHVESLGFDIDAGKHSLKGRAAIDTSFCKPAGKGTERSGIEPIEADFETGKTYYLGYDHSASNRRDWKLVIWKVEDNKG